MLEGCELFFSHSGKTCTWRECLLAGVGGWVAAVAVAVVEGVPKAYLTDLGVGAHTHSVFLPCFCYNNRLLIKTAEHKYKVTLTNTALGFIWDLTKGTFLGKVRHLSFF